MVEYNVVNDFQAFLFVFFIFRKLSQTCLCKHLELLRLVSQEILVPEQVIWYNVSLKLYSLSAGIFLSRFVHHDEGLNIILALTLLHSFYRLTPLVIHLLPKSLYVFQELIKIIFCEVYPWFFILLNLLKDGLVLWFDFFICLVHFFNAFFVVFLSCLALEFSVQALIHDLFDFLIVNFTLLLGKQGLFNVDFIMLWFLSQCHVQLVALFMLDLLFMEVVQDSCGSFKLILACGLVMLDVHIEWFDKISLNKGHSILNYLHYALDSIP